MTAPASGRDDATVRGAVVLIVAIVIGLALLARSGGGGDEDEASSDATTESTASTTTAPGDETTVPIQDSSTTSTTPTGSTQDPATVTVVVLNATEVGGWAGENAGILSAAGYITDDGNFGGENQDVTTIYATPEAQADAQAVASLLDLADAPVTQKPAEPLGDSGQDAEAQVVVVLGADSTAGAGGDTGGTGEETTTTVG